MRSKVLLAIMPLIIAILISILSCEATDKIKTIKLENKSTQEKISDFNEKVEMLTTFCLEIDKLETKYFELNQNAIAGFNNSSSYNEQVPYARVLRNNFLKWSEDLSKLQVYNCLTNAYEHYQRCIKQKCLAISFHLKKDQWGYNKANYSDIEEYNKTRKEVLKIMKALNNEAEELGLPIPYLDFSITLQAVSIE